MSLPGLALRDGTRLLSFRVSEELLPELMTWSRDPVFVKITERKDGTVDLVVQRPQPHEFDGAKA